MHIKTKQVYNSSDKVHSNLSKGMLNSRIQTKNKKQATNKTIRILLIKSEERPTPEVQIK